MKDKKVIQKIWIVLFIVMVILIIIGFYNEKKDFLKLKTDQIIIEYGEMISMEPQDYLIDETDKNIYQDITVSIMPDIEQNKTYPDVGKYVVELKYRHEKVNVDIFVKDTTPPKITEKKQFEIVKGTDLTTVDFQNNIVVDDLSSIIDVSFDFTKIDTNNAGVYDLKVTAIDQYNNQTIEYFNVSIIADLQENEEETITSKNIKKADTSPKNEVSQKNQNENQNENQNNSNVQENDKNDRADDQPIPSIPIHQTVYWAKCTDKICLQSGYQVTSTISQEDVIEKLHAAGHGNNRNCSSYRYGSYEKIIGYQ